MSLSPSSRNAAKPLADLLTAFTARAARRTQLEASGEWGLAFVAQPRLKFITVLKGSCWLKLDGKTLQYLQCGDVCMVGATGYAVSSGPKPVLVDGSQLYAQTDHARLGGDDTVLVGNNLECPAGLASFLVGVLPDLVLIPRSASGTNMSATLLELLDHELKQTQGGSRAVSGRLAELLLIEAVRQHGARPDARAGWLGALADPRLQSVLRLMHEEIAEPWTVQRLAKAAGMSRSAFSALFTERIGQAPLAYLRQLRLTRAKAELEASPISVASVARKVGYGSQSAFGHAYRRAFGVSPKGQC